MYRKIGVIIGLVASLSVSAETIKLSGKVSNKDGKPVAGAIVSLVGQKLLDTTDAQGKFSFSTTGVMDNSRKMSNLEKVTMERGFILFSLKKAAQVKIEVFDISGNLLKKELNHYTSAGDYRFDLSASRSASAMAAVRVTIGGKSSTFRYLASSDKKYFLTSSSLVVPSNIKGLAKIKAAIDTLSVTANGYVTKTIPVPSYDDDGVNITLDTINLPKFSFFLTSLKALQELSGSENGFGGDLRFGKTGQGAGILGADSICQCIAERSMPGSKAKIWRAFLSAKKGPDGKQVNAIERIGNGPWYDRKGRLLANNTSELLNGRPKSAHNAIKNDLPNEDGVPNRYPDPLNPSKEVDNHLTVTGTGEDGKLFKKTSTGGGWGDLSQNCVEDVTCNDWTSTTANSSPRAGFAWPQQGYNPDGGGTGPGFGMGMGHWISGFCLAGCEAGIDLDFNTMAGKPGVKTIGSGGGYGGFYCFALNP